MSSTTKQMPCLREGGVRLGGKKKPRGLGAREGWGTGRRGRPEWQGAAASLLLWALSGGRQFLGAKELAGLCLARHNQLRSLSRWSRSPGVAAARGAGERAARGREQGGGVHGGLLLCVSVSGAVWSDLSFERVTVGNRLQGLGRVG